MEIKVKEKNITLKSISLSFLDYRKSFEFIKGGDKTAREM